MRRAPLAALAVAALAALPTAADTPRAHLLEHPEVASAIALYEI